MKKIKYIATIILMLFQVHLNASPVAESLSRYYTHAYTEIAEMLDGKTELSVKRAVFLTEWAYLDGDLDYDSYCKSIDSAAVFLNKFIIANGLHKYKTGKNLALMTILCNHGPVIIIPRLFMISTVSQRMISHSNS